MKIGDETIQRIKLLFAKSGDNRRLVDAWQWEGRGEVESSGALGLNLKAQQESCRLAQSLAIAILSTYPVVVRPSSSLNDASLVVLIPTRMWVDGFTLVENLGRGSLWRAYTCYPEEVRAVLL